MRRAALRVFVGAQLLGLVVIVVAALMAVAVSWVLLWSRWGLWSWYLALFLSVCCPC